MKLIAQNEIILSSVQDAYSISVTPASIVIQADCEGKNPNLSSAKGNISLIRGKDKVPFEIVDIKQSSPNIQLQMAINQDENTVGFSFVGIGSDILDGWVEFKVRSNDNANFEGTARVNFAVVRETTMLDWVQDWEGSKTKIGDSYILSPKLFIGTKEGNSTTLADGSHQWDTTTLTGVYIGDDLLNTAPSVGIYGYNKGSQMFHLNSEGGGIAGWRFNTNALWIGSTTPEDTAGEFTSTQSNLTISPNGLRSKGWRFEKDGSGAIANGNISWGADGSVNIQSGVTLPWDQVSGKDEFIAQVNGLDQATQSLAANFSNLNTTLTQTGSNLQTLQGKVDGMTNESDSRSLISLIKQNASNIDIAKDGINMQVAQAELLRNNYNYIAKALLYGQSWSSPENKTSLEKVEGSRPYLKRFARTSEVTNIAYYVFCGQGEANGADNKGLDKYYYIPKGNGSVIVSFTIRKPEGRTSVGLTFSVYGPDELGAEHFTTTTVEFAPTETEKRCAVRVEGLVKDWNILRVDVHSNCSPVMGELSVISDPWGLTPANERPALSPVPFTLLSGDDITSLSERLSSAELAITPDAIKTTVESRTNEIVKQAKDALDGRINKTNTNVTNAQNAANQAQQTADKANGEIANLKNSEIEGTLAQKIEKAQSDLTQTAKSITANVNAVETLTRSIYNYAAHALVYGGEWDNSGNSQRRKITWVKEAPDASRPFLRTCINNATDSYFVVDGRKESDSDSISSGYDKLFYIPKGNGRAIVSFTIKKHDANTPNLIKLRFRIRRGGETGNNGEGALTYYDVQFATGETEQRCAVCVSGIEKDWSRLRVDVLTPATFEIGEFTVTSDTRASVDDALKPVPFNLDCQGIMAKEANAQLKIESDRISATVEEIKQVNAKIGDDNSGLVKQVADVSVKAGAIKTSVETITKETIPTLDKRIDGLTTVDNKGVIDQKVTSQIQQAAKEINLKVSSVETTTLTSQGVRNLMAYALQFGDVWTGGNATISTPYSSRPHLLQYSATQNSYFVFDGQGKKEDAENGGETKHNYIPKGNGSVIISFTARKPADGNQIKLAFRLYKQNVGPNEGADKPIVSTTITFGEGEVEKRCAVRFSGIIPDWSKLRVDVNQTGTVVLGEFTVTSDPYAGAENAPAPTPQPFSLECSKAMVQVQKAEQEAAINIAKDSITSTVSQSYIAKDTSKGINSIGDAIGTATAAANQHTNNKIGDLNSSAPKENTVASAIKQTANAINSRVESLQKGVTNAQGTYNYMSYALMYGAKWVAVANNQPQGSIYPGDPERPYLYLWSGYAPDMFFGINGQGKADDVANTGRDKFYYIPKGNGSLIISFTVCKPDTPDNLKSVSLKFRIYGKAQGSAETNVVKVVDFSDGVNEKRCAVRFKFNPTKASEWNILRVDVVQQCQLKIGEFTITSDPYAGATNAPEPLPQPFVLDCLDSVRKEFKSDITQTADAIKLSVTRSEGTDNLILDALKSPDRWNVSTDVEGGLSETDTRPKHYYQGDKSSAGYDRYTHGLTNAIKNGKAIASYMDIWSVRSTSESPIELKDKETVTFSFYFHVPSNIGEILKKPPFNTLPFQLQVGMVHYDENEPDTNKRLDIIRDNIPLSCVPGTRELVKKTFTATRNCKVSFRVYTPGPYTDQTEALTWQYSYFMVNRGSEYIQFSETRQQIKSAGIDLDAEKIVLQSDKVEIKNAKGETTAVFDENGKLTTDVIDAQKLTINAGNEQGRVTIDANGGIGRLAMFDDKYMRVQIANESVADIYDRLSGPDRGRIGFGSMSAMVEKSVDGFLYSPNSNPDGWLTANDIVAYEFDIADLSAGATISFGMSQLAISVPRGTNQEEISMQLNYRDVRVEILANSIKVATYAFQDLGKVSGVSGESKRISATQYANSGGEYTVPELSSEGEKHYSARIVIGCLQYKATSPGVVAIPPFKIQGMISGSYYTPSFNKTVIGNDGIMSYWSDGQKESSLFFSKNKFGVQIGQTAFRMVDGKIEVYAPNIIGYRIWKEIDLSKIIKQ